MEKLDTIWMIMLVVGSAMIMTSIFTTGDVFVPELIDSAMDNNFKPE